MTLTPWGKAGELRERRLAPGPGTARGEVERNQRERIYGAMVVSVAERGYQATRVEDLVTISGVSRSAFYRYFADKRECFLATLRVIMRGTLALVSAISERGEPTEEQAREGIKAMFGLIAAQPAAARLAFIEVYAAGPEAVEAVEASQLAFEQLSRKVIQHLPHQAGMPAPLIRALVGAQRNVIQARLEEGREAELPEIAEELWMLGRGYPAPPSRLGRGRLPPTPPARETCFDPAEEIMAAACEVFARRGYVEARIADIAAAARASRSTLYAHFEGKDELFAAVLDAGQARMLGIALPAYRRARDWPWGVRGAIEARFAFLASHPPYARLASVEAHAAGHASQAFRERATAALGELLEPGYEQAPELPAIATEAIGAGIDALISTPVRAGEAARLRELAPFATYIALTPFIGAERACAIAQARGPARRGG